MAIHHEFRPFDIPPHDKRSRRDGRNDSSRTGGNGQEGDHPKSEGQEAPPFSEDALALDFIARHGENLRYVAEWGRWFQWTGTHWTHENTLAVFDAVRKICRKAAARCNNKKTRYLIAQAKTVASVERLARSDRGVATTAEIWDANKKLLNTPGGTVNLETGILQAHRREDFCSKITAVTPGGECPLFFAFVNTIFAGNKDVIAYLHKVLGYCLTGDTSLHAMFFGYGTGANGKGVLLSTISNILGDYCRTAHIDTFTITGTAQHPTDVAGLMGARLVVCSEVEQGRRWAEAKIKELTGGDRISARFMRQDFFEFTPQFKLFITGNHKPGLRNVDEAMRRRLHLIPFTVTIPEGERDPHLAEKLRAEWPGILQWMIDGCLRQQKEGLAKPDAVATATREYLEAEDTLLAWIEDCCECGMKKRGPAGKLFVSWKAWAELNGEFAGTQKAFAARMAEHGFSKQHTRDGKMYLGLDLIESASKPWA